MPSGAPCGTRSPARRTESPAPSSTGGFLPSLFPSSKKSCPTTNSSCSPGENAFPSPRTDVGAQTRKTRGLFRGAVPHRAPSFPSRSKPRSVPCYVNSRSAHSAGQDENSSTCLHGGAALPCEPSRPANTRCAPPSPRSQHKLSALTPPAAVRAAALSRLSYPRHRIVLTNRLPELCHSRHQLKAKNEGKSLVPTHPIALLHVKARARNSKDKPSLLPSVQNEPRAPAKSLTRCWSFPDGHSTAG